MVGILATTIPAANSMRIVGVLLVFVVLMGLVGWLGETMSARSEATVRERGQGYTTLPDHQLEFAPLWQLDPMSGAVVRRPGEGWSASDHWKWVSEQAEIDPEVSEGSANESHGPPVSLTIRSARSWARIATVCLLASGFLAVVPIALSIANSGAGPYYAAARIVPPLVGVAGGLLCGWPLARMRQAAAKESAAGYTSQGTVGALFEALGEIIWRRKPRYDHLWRLDPRTGRVIRPPRTPPAGSGPSPDVAGSDGPGSGVPL